MASRKTTGILACAAIFALTLVSGCGSSSTQNIPSSATIFYAHTVIFRHSSSMTIGYNAFGQLGDGTLNSRSTAAIVPGLGHLVGFATGADHTLAFDNGTTVKAWGYNGFGQLGNLKVIPTGNAAASKVPVSVPGFGGQNVTSVAAGGFHSLAVAGGTVYGWGYNGFGQVGNGNFVNQGVPVQVKDATDGTVMTTAKEVAAGGYHSVVLLNNGAVYAWGRNSFGQLGIDPSLLTFSQVPQPISFVPPLPVGSALPEPAVNPADIEHVYAAGSYCLALETTRDGSGNIIRQRLWGWGNNQAGQLGKDPVGPPPVTSISTPRELLNINVTGATTPIIKKVSAGGNHILVMMGAPGNNNTVQAIGLNFFAQLGDGDVNNTDKSSFVAVLGLDGGTPPNSVVDIIAFGDHSLAKVDDGTPLGKWYGWGDNGFGQLGNPVSNTSIGFLTKPTLVGGYLPTP